MHYEMRITKGNNDDEYLNKMIRASKITSKTINSIPCVELTSDNSLNNLIRITHMKLLEASMLRHDEHRYDEVGILMELVEPYQYEVYFGKVDEKTGISSIKSNDSRFLAYIAKHSKEQLMFMHNHPNNSCFSYGDLCNFILTDEIKIITAVGNSHGVHSMCKDKNFNKNETIKYLKIATSKINLKDNTEDIGKKRDRIVLDIIKNISKLGIKYRYSESKDWRQ